MAYKYRAYTSDNKVVQGTIEVSSESLAEGALYDAGFRYVLSLKEVAPSGGIRASIPTIFGVKTQDVIDFFNQLATLIGSGVSILTALKMLQGQASRPSLKTVLADLIDRIQAGSAFSQALSHHPAVFPHTYVQVIRASEQVGSLDSGLKQAAADMTRQAATARKIRRALSYPIFVLLMAIGVVIMLMFVALPPLVELFESFDANLPWMTQLLLAVSGFVLANGGYIIAVIVGLIVIYILLLRIPSVRLAKERGLLGLPIIGSIIIERGVTHFCQTAAMLLQSGLHITQVMDIATETNKNPIIRQALRGIKDRLVQGEGLSQPLTDEPLFPPLLGEMALVGEKTGTMDTTLATLADYYEQRVDRRIESLTGMLEPLLTFAVGLVIIFIALSIMTPLYSILKQIG